jgi:hypothetical protein
MGLSVIMLAYPAASCGECACNRFHLTFPGKQFRNNGNPLFGQMNPAERK